MGNAGIYLRGGARGWNLSVESFGAGGYAAGGGEPGEASGDGERGGAGGGECAEVSGADSNVDRQSQNINAEGAEVGAQSSQRKQKQRTAGDP